MRPTASCTFCDVSEGATVASDSCGLDGKTELPIIIGVDSGRTAIGDSSFDILGWPDAVFGATAAGGVTVDVSGGSWGVAATAAKWLLQPNANMKMIGMTSVPNTGMGEKRCTMFYISFHLLGRLPGESASRETLTEMYAKAHFVRTRP